MKKIFILIFSVFTIMVSCNTMKYTLEELPDRQLIFGNGGGFTGASKSYILLENGQIFRINSLTDTKEEMASIKKKEANAYFKNLTSFRLDTTHFEHPGNRYYFIKQKEGDELYSILWGDKDFQISKPVEELYKSLIESINTKSE